MDYKALANWTLIVILLALGGYMAYYIHTQSFQCLSNPYGYSIKLLEKSNQASVGCSCTVSKPTGNINFFLTDKGIEQIPKDNPFILYPRDSKVLNSSS